MVLQAVQRTAILALALVVGVGPVASASLINVSPTSDATGGSIAVAGIGDANATCVDVVLGCVPGVAVAGVGDATGGVAVTYAGQANSSYVSASVLSPTDSNNVAVSGQGEARAGLVAVSLLGDARCGNSPCVAISLTGDAATLGGCTLLRAAAMSAYCGTQASDMALNLLG